MSFRIDDILNKPSNDPKTLIERRDTKIYSILENTLKNGNANDYNVAFLNNNYEEYYRQLCVNFSDSLISKSLRIQTPQDLLVPNFIPYPVICPYLQLRRKGTQIRFTTNQTEELEKQFVLHKYLSPEERKQLANLLQLSDRQVKTWFQNRRAKWRRNSENSAYDKH